jgi:hypothetical protein
MVADSASAEPLKALQKGLRQPLLKSIRLEENFSQVRASAERCRIQVLSRRAGTRALIPKWMASQAVRPLPFHYDVHY